MKEIYLDHAATTRPDSIVLEKMREAQEMYWGNASSIHSVGQKAKQILEECRKSVAFFIGADADEIIFTSGGTESDNLAIKGIVDSFYRNFQSKPNDQNSDSKSANNSTIQQFNNDEAKPHVITSAFEHHAVLDTIKDLEKKGLIEATYVKPNAKGLIEVKDVEAAIKDNTVLVSIMYVNNEIGTVQPIREIGKLISEVNSKRQDITNDNSKKIAAPSTMRMARNDNNLAIHQLSNKILFHTDAVQAAEYFELSPEYLGVDLLSIAAHKFYGPKGVGALFVKKGTPIIHQQIGGGQERKRRAGTENIAGIVGMTAALNLIFKQRADEDIEIEGYPSGAAKEQGDQAYIEGTQAIVKKLPNMKLDKTTYRIIGLRDKLIDGILKNISDTRLNGDREMRSPANANISFMHAEGESIILMLDLAGIAASSGSACTSGSLDPSHVLLSIGLKHEEAHGSVRFTLGKHTTEEEIEKVLEVLPPIIERLRAMSPIGK